MSRFRLARSAQKDLDDIDEYLSHEAGDDVAERITGELLDACRLLSTQPGMGHRRADLVAADVRFWPVRSYLIVYREGAPLEIVRIWNARQDPSSLRLTLEGG